MANKKNTGWKEAADQSGKAPRHRAASIQGKLKTTERATMETNRLPMPKDKNGLELQLGDIVKFKEYEGEDYRLGKIGWDKYRLTITNRDGKYDMSLTTMHVLLENSQTRLQVVKRDGVVIE